MLVITIIYYHVSNHNNKRIQDSLTGSCPEIITSEQRGLLIKTPDHRLTERNCRSLNQTAQGGRAKNQQEHTTDLTLASREWGKIGNLGSFSHPSLHTPSPPYLSTSSRHCFWGAKQAMAQTLISIPL